MLPKISALQTKVELAGNLSDKQNLAENLAYRELVASWEKVFFWCTNSLHFYKFLAGNYIPDAITVK